MEKCRFDSNGRCRSHSESGTAAYPGVYGCSSALCTHAAQALRESRDGLRNAAEGLLKTLDPRAALADFGRMSDEEIRCCLEASRRAVQALRQLLREANDLPAMKVRLAKAERRVEEVEQGLVRMCPPGTCKVQPPALCTCIVVVADLQTRLASLEAAADVVRQSNAKMLHEIDRLEAANAKLRRYVRHDPECKIDYTKAVQVCTCGLAAAVAPRTGEEG